MKISNLQAIGFINTVNEMKGKSLPVRVSFAIRHNFNLIMDNQVKAYEEARLELEKQTEDEQGKYFEGLNKLLAEEVEHEIKKVDLAELEKLDADPSYARLTISELDAISFMLNE